MTVTPEVRRCTVAELRLDRIRACLQDYANADTTAGAALTRIAHALSAPDDDSRKDPTMQTDPIMQFFEYEHLPPKLQEISRPFCELAKSIAGDVSDATPGTSLGIPRNAERTVALRKLLEAKDCAVRAALYKPAEG